LSAPSYTPQLRPLSVGEILDAGFRLFNARFVTLVLCVLVPVVPLEILSAALQASVDPTAFDLDSTEPEWALGYRFDIVLRGREATPTEA
jgi:protocatechuate 3,4-dioxygenase beta subunit